MSRNRIIYQSQAVYASQVSATGVQTGVGTIAQLTRVQDFSFDFSRNLTDVNQFGELAAIDRIDLEAPTVSCNLSYLLSDASNEKYLGLSITTGNVGGISCLSGILNKLTDQKNIYLLIVDEGNDAVNYNGATSGVVGIGNTFVTSYKMDAAVGSLAKASATIEALNCRIYADANGGENVPAITPANGLSVTGVPFLLRPSVENDSVTEPTALRPGDVEFSLSGVWGALTSDLKVQSVSLGVDLSRTPLQKLGSRFPFSREINFPVSATIDVQAELGDLSDSNLADLLCDTGVYNLAVNIRKNACSGNGAYAMRYSLIGAKLDSESFSSAIGSNSTVSMKFSVPLSGPNATNGLQISGSFS